MEREAMETLEQSFADVLERFAFMFAEPQSLDELPPPLSELCRVTIRFKGPRSGLLALVAGSEIGEQLAANILGLEPRLINQEAGDDAFKELLNITCGEFLERFAGTEAVFDLSVPQLDRTPAGEWANLIKDPMCRGLLVETIPVLIRLEL